jgi:hypothetical protein
MFALTNSKKRRGNVSSTIIALLAAWLGLNVAFVAMRFYVTAGKRPRMAPKVVEYPMLLNVVIRPSSN